MGEKKIEDFITIDQVSEMIKMPKSTIYQKVQEGQLRSYKPGKKILFDPAEVRAYVKRFASK